jgi:MtaA/CmuA family methyltransferase
MNSLERLQKRLRGEPVDRPPNFDILMIYASHYIGQPLSHFWLDPRVLCDANFAVQEAFGLDILQAISDSYREAQGFGLQVSFPEDDLPRPDKPLLVELSDIAKLRQPDPHVGRMADTLESLRIFHERAGGEIAVMGWVEGALAEAADLRDVSQVLIDLYDNPEWLADLLERIVETEIAFARAQITAGADIIGLGDAIASQVSAKMYRKFALPYEQRIVAAIHEMGALARLHICGNTSHILEDMVQTGADIIDLDWMVDFSHAAALFGGRTVPCGNFDPVAVMLQGKPEQVYHATQSCLRADPLRAISAAGCEIPDQTPVENLLAQKRAIAAFEGI